MAVFGVHVFRRRGPFVFDAWPKLARVEKFPPLNYPRRNAPVEALGVLLGELPPWPNKRPGVEDAGEREGNIERVRQWRCCAFRSPPSPERNLPRGRPHRHQGRPSRAAEIVKLRG